MFDRLVFQLHLQLDMLSFFSLIFTWRKIYWLNTCVTCCFFLFSTLPIFYFSGHLNDLRVLYGQNKTPSTSTKKNARHIPQVPERILDAPDLIDDYCKLLTKWEIIWKLVGDNMFRFQFIQSIARRLLKSTFKINIWMSRWRSLSSLKVTREQNTVKVTRG